MTGCVHCIVKDIYEKREFKDENGVVYGHMNEHVAYKHLCDGGHQNEYDDWHERNKENTYEVYKNDFLPCYEPTDVAENLGNMISIAEDILGKLKQKENETRTNTEG